MFFFSKIQGYISISIRALNNFISLSCIYLKDQRSPSVHPHNGEEKVYKFVKITSTTCIFFLAQLLDFRQLRDDRVCLNEIPLITNHS
jgi:hypothetical protein